MTPKDEPVAAERVKDNGSKKWQSARLHLDPVAGTVELKGRGRPRRRWSETYHASQISDFKVVMVGDRLAKVYGSLIGLAALLILSTWVPEDTFWEPVVELGKYVVMIAR